MICRHKVIAALTVLAIGGVGLAFQTTPPSSPPKPTPPSTTPPARTPTTDQKSMDAPPAVRSAAEKFFGAGAFTIQKEVKDGYTCWKAIGSKDGMQCELALIETGDIACVEKDLDQATLPAAAKTAIQKSHPNAKIADVQWVQKTFYTVKFDNNQQAHVYANGAPVQLDARASDATKDRTRDESRDTDDADRDDQGTTPPPSRPGNPPTNPPGNPPTNPPTNPR